MANKIELPNIDHWVAKYLGGMSVNQMSKQAKVSRHTITRNFIDYGVTMRTQSQAETVKWQTIKQTVGGVERQCSAAWAAADARDDKLEREAIHLYTTTELGHNGVAEALNADKSNVSRILKKNGIKCAKPSRRRAVTRSNNANSPIISPWEVELLTALHDIGVDAKHQTAIDDINVDFTVGDIAIELERRCPAESKSITQDRVKKIFSSGYSLLVVYLPRGTVNIGTVDWSVIAQHVVASLDAIHADPTPVGKYGVITGRRKSLAATCNKLNSYTLVTSNHRCFDVP